MSDKWTKEDLETAAEEFNQVIGFDPPIPTGDTTTVEQLENDIKDIVENVLRPGDRVSEKTTELLELMGLRKQETVEDPEKEGELKEEPEKEGVPEKLKDEKPLKKVTEGKGKAVDKTQTKKEGKVKGKAKKDKSKKISGQKNEMTRIDCYIQAIEEVCKKGATKKQIIDNANKIYRENGGKAKCKATAIAGVASNVLLKFKVLSEEENGIIKFT